MVFYNHNVYKDVKTHVFKEFKLCLAVHYVDGSCFARDTPLCDLWTPAVPRGYFRHCSRTQTVAFDSFLNIHG